MFAFKLYGNFGVFRDPLTITQNITFSIPPKTTMGGMLAAILGIDYNDYFNDSDYFDFRYSVVLNDSIRKKTFAQNYVENYTIKTETKLRNFSTDRFFSKMTKAKPIHRELLINPSYIIFIDNYKYENKIVDAMKRHESSFLFYMGNSEFAANYELLDCIDVRECLLDKVDSFTKNLDQISFESINKYSIVHFATKIINNRQYRNYQKIVYGEFGKQISFTEPINGFSIKTQNKEYNCEFI